MNDTKESTTVRLTTPEELAASSPQPRIIDVREAAEFSDELGHIPGAELVPLGTLEQAARAWPKDDTIVVVCRSGGRSARGAALLAKLGFRRVRDLEGGMRRYVAAGLHVVRG